MQNVRVYDLNSNRSLSKKVSFDFYRQSVLLIVLKVFTHTTMHTMNILKKLYCFFESQGVMKIVFLSV